jgi:hypothetical protein
VPIEAEALATAVTLAVVQTTQADHERRIALLEALSFRVILFTAGAMISSVATLAAVVVDTLARTGKP